MKNRLWLKNESIFNASQTAWSKKEVALKYLWNIVWTLLYRPSLKHPFNPWRLFLLRVFGAKISGHPFVFPSSKIFVPWNLSLGDKSCLGPYTTIYNLGPVEIKQHVTISQESMICNGTHDLSLMHLPLLVGKVTIDNYVFIGARALILPGINISEFSVIGAGSVLTKDTEPYDVVGGNPAKFIKKRVILDK